MQDDEIIIFLQGLSRPTFFARDEHFYERRLCHAKYSLVYMEVDKYEAAFFVRRLLHHSEFNTQTKRMGAVICVSAAWLSVWRVREENETRLGWD